MVKLETVETKASNLDIEVSKNLHSQCIKHRRSPEKLLREDNVGEKRRVKEMGSLREYGKKRTGSRIPKVSKEIKQISQNYLKCSYSKGTNSRNK